MICIGLGDQKSFCIDDNMEMIVRSDVLGEDKSLSLGKATIENLDSLVCCINRLRHQCIQVNEKVTENTNG